MHKIKKKEESRKRIFRNAQRENGEAQLHMTTWAKHHRRRVPGLATSPPRKGGGQASQPRCARTLGASAPNATQPGCSLCRRLQASMLRLFSVVFVFTYAEPSYIHYLRRGEAHLTTHIIWSPTSLPPLVVSFIVLVVIFWSKESYLESLSPWEKEQLLV